MEPFGWLLRTLDQRQLQELVGEGTWNINYVNHVVRNGEDFFAAACEHNLEGIMNKQIGSL